MATTVIIDNLAKQQNIAKQTFYDAMDSFYRRLRPNDMRLFRAFMESGMEIENGYSDDHYYQLEDGSFDGACFPLPVIEVMNVCDVFTNDGSIDVYVSLLQIPPTEMLNRYKIKEMVDLRTESGELLFRMEFDEEDEVVVGFAKELKRILTEKHIKEIQK